ncbi:MAG TPA: NADH-quinone oxidoreductase subunit J [Acidimicrobiales bacterium]|jgi:NADH-quinone oxidoreductase subunit J|nr:NADH-quinone oxidoreductase subunit J [Acidimicrobiales bacterium]HMS88992.1 NADH-quinone oxidoreductase subunit J [Acidimicrobiales bacterium]HRA34285.1 NADH-quinone oxidoreductase subunit J [Acidimicrobiales bacterium]
METFVFIAGAFICLLGALGVITSENPVHSALSLVGTLIGVAVLFIAQDAEFLAAVQVIVYAGAIVVLFLFVIMLIGVDRSDDIQVEPLTGQRVAAAVVGLVLAVGLVAVVTLGSVTGAPASPDPVVSSEPNTEAIGRVLFTDHLLAFEITSVLLVIAVVGAVALARHRGAALLDDEHPGDAVPELASDDAVAGEVAS